MYKLCSTYIQIHSNVSRNIDKLNCDLMIIKKIDFFKFFFAECINNVYTIPNIKSMRSQMELPKVDFVFYQKKCILTYKYDLTNVLLPYLLLENLLVIPMQLMPKLRRSSKNYEMHYRI